MVRLAQIAAAGAGLLPGVLGANLLVSHYTGKIFSLSYTAPSGGAGNGTLAVISSIGGCGSMPAWLQLDSASGTVYCVDEGSAAWGGSPVVASFSVANDGGLKAKGSAKSSGGDVHGWLYGGSDGKGFLATSQYDPSTITTYKLPLSSSTQVLQKEKFTMSGPGPVKSRQNAPHPHSAITDPTGKFLLVPDLGADLIRIFSIDAASGKLTACPAAKTGAGDGPRHGAWWKPARGSGTTGTMLYTVNELSNTVSAWTTTYPGGSNGGCLTLARTQTLSTFASGRAPPAGAQPIKAAEVHVAGNFLYAANRNDQSFGAEKDALATFAIDAASGALRFVENTNSHTWYPRTFAINKAGDLVAVGGQTSSNVAVLARDPATGKIGGLVANLQVATRGRDGQEDGLSAVIWDE